MKLPGMPVQPGYNACNIPGFQEFIGFRLESRHRPWKLSIASPQVGEVTEERWLVYTEPVQLESDAVTELYLGCLERCCVCVLS